MPSRDPRIRAIEQEAARRAMEDGRTSHQERFNIRAGLRSEQGLGRETRKRGGVGGVWDRNKGAIGSVAGGLAASFIPGAGAFLLPALGGALGGAAARGKFDAGNLIGDTLGGVSGGQVPNAVGALRGAFTGGAGGAAGAATAGAGAPAMPPGFDLSNVANANVVGQRSLGGMARAAGGFLRENPEVVGMGLQAAGQAQNAAANRSMQRDAMNFERQQYEDEQERRRRIGELLLPMWNKQQGAGALPMPQLPRLGG